MAVTLKSSSPWPARAAYVAAAIFIGASGATNVAYGWQRGVDLPTSIIWAAVAAAVAVLFTLSWPAFIRACEERRVFAALIALCTLLLSGAFSVSAAFGSASGGRVQAAEEGRSTQDARERSRAAYDAARADLARLPAARPVGELEALLAAAQRAPQRHGCAAVNGSLRLSCPALEAELARSRERERLAGVMEKASGELAAIKQTRPANQDAAALARYLQAIGLNTSAERLNDALVLLSVLMIEAGGGLSLALAMALAPVNTPERSPEHPAGRSAGHLNTTRRTPRTPPPRAAPQTAVAPPPAVSPGSSLLTWLEAQGGSVLTSSRRLASALGRSPSAVHAEMKRLVAEGMITAASGPAGTRIEIQRH